jgi:hypothetical protein
MPSQDVTLKLIYSASPFLGTGHHFYFIKFPSSPSVELQDLTDAFARNDCPWILFSDQESEKCLLWLRGRIQQNEPGGGLGLMLCLDTNVGSSSRGWPVAPNSPAPTDTVQSVIGKLRDKEPYIFSQESEAPTAALVRNVLFSHTPRSGVTYNLQLALTLEFPHAIAEPVDVDLIVDFGNTRTVVLALEHNQAANGYLSQVCRPIEFFPRNVEPHDENSRNGNSQDAIIDSWFVLAEPLFSCLEPPSEDDKNECAAYSYEICSESRSSGFWLFKKESTELTGFRKVLPNSCVQVSPAVMGIEAEYTLPVVQIEMGGNVFLSSPKRYSWDTDVVGHLGKAGRTFWTMHVNPWHARYANYMDRKEFPKLAASILLLMDQNGGDWQLADDGSGLPSERAAAAARPTHSPNAPAYPRSDALTWAAVTVLEASYRHIMSDIWRTKMQSKFVRRRIKNVLVTYPSGWTGQELRAYRAKWQKAIDIFTAVHLENRRPIEVGGDRPNLLMELDEAVASQLPVVYGEIHKLGNVGENWIELVGRGKGVDARVRIMNLDIGGGTSDIAVIEYHDENPGPGVVLNTELLFKDSSTTAGDALVRRAIEAVLLPAIRAGLMEEPASRFDRLLSSAKQDKGAQWNRITRQVFIPIIRRWLGDLTSGQYNDLETGAPPTPAVMLRDHGGQRVKELNDICASELGVPTVLDGTHPIYYDVARLRLCVEEVLGDFFRSLAKISESFDCDLLIVSGKPSELPSVRQLLCKVMPLPYSRIMFTHNYHVGAWYPLSNDGKVHDAKTVTVAGAALYQAIKLSLLPNWVINPTKRSRFFGRNFWGIMPLQGKRDFESVILAPEDEKKTVSLMVNARIGRRRLPTRSRPDPVYLIRWSAKGRQLGNEALPIRVTFERVVPDANPDGIDAVGETLLLSNVEAKRGGKAVSLDDLELQLCTLDNDDHWIDSSIYHIELKK